MTGTREFSARASSKLILLGEHAAVFGHPTVAVPLDEPCAAATARLTAPGEGVRVELRDFQETWRRGDEAASHEARAFAALVGAALAAGRVPDNGWALSAGSAIPIGCGLGSGAAVAAAAFRAVYGLFGVERPAAALSGDVYAVEKLHHGNPSGVDNTVVAHGRPVLFCKGSAPAFLAAPASPVFLAVGDTGGRRRTSDVVAEVAARRERKPAFFDGVFKEIGRLAAEGARAFEAGDLRRLGALMDENQGLLESVCVDSREINLLVAAGRGAGALGAKLCGAGKGGCVAALAESREHAGRLVEAFLAAGAKRAFAARAASTGETVPAGRARPGRGA